MTCYQRIALFLMLGWLAACTKLPPASQAQVTPSPPAAPRVPEPSATTPGVILTHLPPLSAEESARWQQYPSYNDVRGLAFAPDGSLWAATIGGVVHWDLDTDTPTRYVIPGGPLSHIPHQIMVTDDGSVWIATSSGLARFAPGQDVSNAWRVYTVADGLPSDVVYSIALTPGAIWAGTETGLARLDATAPAETARWVPYTLEKGAPQANIRYMAAGAGALWASVQGSGMIRYDAQSDTWMAIGGDFAYANVGVVAIAPDGSPWVHIGYDNVYRFDGATWQMAYAATGGRWVCDMAFGKDETPYMATCGGFHSAGTGLAYRVSAQWAYLTPDGGLLANDLSAVALAPNDDLAVGTDRGISLRQNGTWRTLRYGPALREVTTVAVAPDNTVWIGFGTDAFYPPGGGLARMTGDGRWQYFDRLVLFDRTNIQKLAFDPSGVLWIGGGIGVNSLSHCCDADSSRQAWTLYEDSMVGNVRDIAFAPDGAIWMITEFNVYRRDDAELTTFGDKLPTTLAVAPDGKVWLAHSTLAGGGLSVFDGTDWITQTNLPLAQILSLVVTADGAVWASGAEGVLRFSGGQWTGNVETLDAETAYSSLLVAPDGDVWGLAAHSLAHWAGNQREMIGLPFAMTLYDGAFAPDGTLWLGTDQGLVRYRSR